MASGFIAIAVLDVRLPGSATLKDRRSVLARLRGGLVERFGASVADVGAAGPPQRGALVAALAAPTQGRCDELVQRLEGWLDEQEAAVDLRLVRCVTPEDLE